MTSADVGALRWTFDTHMADNTNLEFRAQVSFLLDGVPHHVAGAWQQSKKLAQRDCAERCLGAKGLVLGDVLCMRPLCGLLGCVPTSIHGGHGAWCGSIRSHPSSSKAARQLLEDLPLQVLQLIPAMQWTGPHLVHRYGGGTLHSNRRDHFVGGQVGERPVDSELFA